MNQMKPKAKCRRCSECREASHHWIDWLPDEINREIYARPDGPNRLDPTHACKHCPQLGVECLVCCGDGVDYDNLDGQCAFCAGEGVVPLERHRLLAQHACKLAEHLMTRWDDWEAEAGRDGQQYQSDIVAGCSMQGKVDNAVQQEFAKYLLAVERQREAEAGWNHQGTKAPRGAG